MTRRGCLWALLKPVLIVAVFGAFLAFAAFPWAIPLPGRDSLDGAWIGELHTNDGPAAWLLLSLKPSRSYQPRLFRYAPLGGGAVVCTARRRTDFDISGDTTTWSGASFDVLLRPTQPSPSHLRLEFQGQWNGHTVEVSQRNRSLADILSASGSGGNDPESSKFISSQLRKARRSDFDDACRRLK